MAKSTLNIEDIHAAYEFIRGNLAVESFYALVAGFMVLTLISRVINTCREVQQNDDGSPTMKDYMSMVYQYIFCIVAVMLVPSLLGILENVFGMIMTAMQDKLGASTYNVAEIFNKPIEQEFEKQMDTDYFGVLVNPLGKAIDYLLMYLVGAICAPIYLHTSTIFIAGRYMFLLLLELVSPVAIACFYNEQTRTYFFQWCKSLLVCYLMVPAFILASQFADNIVCQFIMTTPWAVSLQIIYSMILKFSLLGVTKSKISNLF